MNTVKEKEEATSTEKVITKRIVASLVKRSFELTNERAKRNPMKTARFIQKIAFPLGYFKIKTAANVDLQRKPKA